MKCVKRFRRLKATLSVLYQLVVGSLHMNNGTRERVV